MAPLVKLASRRRGQAPPPWVVFEALVDPLRANARPWFDVRPGEQAPATVEQTKPSLVVWSSIWSEQPELQIRIDVEPDGSGSMVTWELLGPEGSLDADDIRQRKYRLNQLINGQLRDTFDQ